MNKDDLLKIWEELRQDLVRLESNYSIIKRQDFTFDKRKEMRVKMRQLKARIEDVNNQLNR